MNCNVDGVEADEVLEQALANCHLITARLRHGHKDAPRCLLAKITRALLVSHVVRERVFESQAPQGVVVTKRIRDTSAHVLIGPADNGRTTSRLPIAANLAWLAVRTAAVRASSASESTVGLVAVLTLAFTLAVRVAIVFGVRRVSVPVAAVSVALVAIASIAVVVIVALVLRVLIICVRLVTCEGALSQRTREGAWRVHLPL